MKKAIVIIIVLSICVSLVACQPSEYDKAVSLYNNGEYSDALDIFLTLGDHQDSQYYITDCRYNLALEAMNKGDYTSAKDNLMKLGAYKDCADLIKECNYQRALALLEEKEYAQALEIMETMSDYKNCQERISKAKWDALYDHIVGKGGSISFQIGNNSSQKLFMETNDNGSINIIFQGVFLLLTIQENVVCRLTLEYGNTEADYAITCSAKVNWKVTEVLNGKINVADFSAQMSVPEGYYQHTTEKPNETVVLTSIPSGTAFTFVVKPTHTAICENLPMLLEKTDVGIATSDLGFTFE